MRPWLRTLLAMVLSAGILISAWWYLNRRRLARQWGCYRVATAESFQQAQDEIAWFENGPDRHARLGELARTWGTGKQQFDFYLARHVCHADSSELLRETFSQELGRRQDLLPRWAHYWSYRARPDPDEQIRSILNYLETLFSAGRLREITWRDVLDVQAVFQLTGHPERARGLSPANWHEHYRLWLETRPDELPHVARPKKPFADWQGPVSE